jgi:ammonia channel protein AmtB
MSSAAGGLLAGCVAITAGCANVSLGSAAAVGLSSCGVLLGVNLLYARLNIDDPLEAS